MIDYRETSTYEYILSYFTYNNQITEPSIVNSTVFDRAKSAQNTPSIYPIKNDEGQNHLDYTYYTHIYNPETNTYSPLDKKDVISCAYSFTNITKYYDEDHNEFTSPTVTQIDTNGTIHVNDVGIAQIKTDFYENTYYYIDSTYYNLKVLYPTKLSLNYEDYFKDDLTLISEEAHKERIDKVTNQIDQLVDCTEKFDSEHDIIQNNVFVRFPDRKYINYKVEGFEDIWQYNDSFSPNYIYNYKLSSDISEDALNIFNELTGTLSLKSEYINNNSYVDITCKLLKERDNFFSPYYFKHSEVNDNPLPVDSNDPWYDPENPNNVYHESSIIFRHYFKKYLPMKYELEDNTHIVYLNEAIEESLKNKQNDGLVNIYGPTKVTFTLNGLSTGVNVFDNTIGQYQSLTSNGQNISFDGIFGHEYTFSIENTELLIGNVYDSNNNDAAISNTKFKFIISRRSDRSKCIIVQNITIGTQNPALTSINSDSEFKQWIENHANNINIENIEIKIGSSTLQPEDDNYVPETISKKQITISFIPSIKVNDLNNFSLTILNTPIIKIKDTETTVSGLKLDWSSSDTFVAKINNTNKTVNTRGYGTTTIKATFEGNESYESASGQYTLIVEKSSDSQIDPVNIIVHFAEHTQNVSKESYELIDIQDVTISPSNWASKGYKRKYTITPQNTDVAEITNDNKIQVKTAGTVKIKCTLTKSDDTYLASDEYTLNITLNTQARVIFNMHIIDWQNSEYSGSNFYPTVIIISPQESYNIFYQTTIQQNTKISLTKDSHCVLSRTYDGALMPYIEGNPYIDNTTPDDHSRCYYLTNPNNLNTIYVMVQGYIDSPTTGKLVYFKGTITQIPRYTPKNPPGATQNELQIDFIIDGQLDYKAQNPFTNDNELNIDILNQAYSEENKRFSDNIIYGEGENENNENLVKVNGTYISLEEFGLIQIEEMPELYLPKDLKDEQYKKLEYTSSNTKVAEIVYYDYDSQYGTETCLFELSEDGKTIIYNYDKDQEDQVTHRLKPKLLIHRDGESEISVRYIGDDVYAETIDIKFKLIVKLKGNVKLSLDEDKFEIERQLASAIDELIDDSTDNEEDPISGFQTFQSPTPNVICEETIPILFEYFSSNNAIGAPYGDLGNILIFDVGTIKVTIKLKETKKYHSTITSYQLTIKNPPDKTKTILNVEQAYYQIRYTQYVDKKIYRVYDSYGYINHLVFETNLYSEIAKIKDNLQEVFVHNNIKEYVINKIDYYFYYKNSDTPCAIYNDKNKKTWLTDNYIDFMNSNDHWWLFDNLNGENIPLFDYESIEYYDNFSKAKVRLNCYDVLDEDGNHGYYIYSKGLTNRLKNDANNFIKGPILGTYIDKHLKPILQKDSLGLLDTTYPTYSENFSTYGMQIINIDNPKESKAFKHAFIPDLEEYLNNSNPDNRVNISSVKGGCTFYVKQSKISKDDYDWKEKLMFLKDYDDEELNHQIFKSKYTSNNTDADVEYIFTSSSAEIAKTNSNGDVIIYDSGKVKIMIRSTETQNFTAGETGYVLDILPKESPMLEAKYNRYLYEMDTTLVENVFGCPDFEWNNTDPDAKLLFWLRSGGPIEEPTSYLTLEDIDGLNLDETNPDDKDNEENPGEDTPTEESSEYIIETSLPLSEGQSELVYINLGIASQRFYELCQNTSNKTNIEIGEEGGGIKKIKLKNCIYKFYSSKIDNNLHEIIKDDTNNLSNLFFIKYLNIEYSISWNKNSFNNGDDLSIFKSQTDDNGIVKDNIIQQNVDGTFTIKFYLNAIPIFNVTNDHLGYFLEEKVIDNDGYTSRSYPTNDGWYGIDPCYALDDPSNDQYLRIYSDKYKKRYVKRNDGTIQEHIDQRALQELISIYGINVSAWSPQAYLDGITEIQHIFVNSSGEDNENEEENYGSSNNIYSDNINDDVNRSSSINNIKGEIIYGDGEGVNKDDFNTSLIIPKNIVYQKLVTHDDGTYEYINVGENGEPLSGDTELTSKDFHVSVDDAGNITIENGLIGHVINVLVKSIETDNFKPKYLVYNLVIKSILDRGNNGSGSDGDGIEQGNGYSVFTTKKTNTITLNENLIEVRTNPDTTATTYKTITAPVFNCGSNDPELKAEYYIYDGGVIGSGSEWYATHYSKEFKREWLIDPKRPTSQNIVELINGKTYKRTSGQEIGTITVINRYDTKFYYNGIETSINKDNGNLTISSKLYNHVINVMIYFPATSGYYDNCVFYNVKVLKKNETVLTLPQNIFTVSQPYPYSGIFQFPEVKTNNTDTDEIKYYIIARQVGRVLHDTSNFTEHLDSGDNQVTFNNGGTGDLYWETTYGHYADDFNTEKNNYNSSGIPKYEPTDILSDNYTYIINMDYPYSINNGNTLFSIYKNNQIRYTNQAGRYVLNVCVISEETTNFLQGYGFYNLEVEVKDEPTLGVYPAYMEVKVGTDDVYVEVPKITCSNDDTNATLSFKIYINEDLSTPYTVQTGETPEITIDDVGNIIIKGNLFTNNSSTPVVTPGTSEESSDNQEENKKHWWIKVISNPSPNFGLTWTKFEVCAVPKDDPILAVYPPYIEVKVGTDDVYVEVPKITCLNNDEDAMLIFEIYDENNNIVSDDDSQIQVDEIGNITIFGNLFSNNSGTTGETITSGENTQEKQWKIKAISKETKNFIETSVFFTVCAVPKDIPTLGTNPPYIEIMVGTDDVYVEPPKIISSNTDEDATLSFEIYDENNNAVSDNDSQIQVDDVGYITIFGNLFTNNINITEKTWWIKVISNPSINFDSAETKFKVHAIPKKVQSISYCPSTIILRPSTELRTIIPDINIQYTNTDEDCILTYTSNPSNIITMNNFGIMTVQATDPNTNTFPINTTITIESNETEHYQKADSSIYTYQFTVSIAAKTTPILNINGNNGGSISMDLTRTVVTGSEVFMGPTIEHTNTDKDAKIIYISNDTSTLTVTPKGALMVYKTGTVTLTIKLKETENFTEASQDITINITQQTIPSNITY